MCVTGRDFHRARASQSIFSTLPAFSAQDNFLVGKELSPALYQEERSPFLSWSHAWAHVTFLSPPRLFCPSALPCPWGLQYFPLKRICHSYPAIEANSDFQSCYNPWYIFAMHIAFTEKKFLTDAVVRGMSSVTKKRHKLSSNKCTGTP